MNAENIGMGYGAAVAEEIDLLFIVNIEGREHKWHKPTITVLEIRGLGNLPLDQPVVCEDEEGRERSLADHETITIKHGHRHGRAPKYKRG
jgi:hypothetical protein